MKVVPIVRNLNHDIECLDCGERNIPDNLICGHCGANLPLVYGEDGKPRVVTDDPYRYSTISGRDRNKGVFGGTAVRGERARWMIRILIVVGALLAAVWLISHR